MAGVHVDTWRETYRGLMPDAVLDDPLLPGRREKFWAAALTDPRYGQNRTAVASYEGALIGIAMAGPSPDDAEELRQLYVLYAYAAFHGSGVGTALLNAVIDPATPAALWVADPNPRAQAFYRKNGFVADGAVKIDGEMREVRMVCCAQAAAARQSPSAQVLRSNPQPGAGPETTSPPARGPIGSTASRAGTERLR